VATGTVPIQSDPTLLAEVRRYGKFDAAACYQCGSCTLTCELVSQAATFPRHNIRHVLLGLRGPLLASLGPWICQDCGECSLLCPRHAEPRISMMTIRRFLTAQYDWTGISSRLLRSRVWHAAVLAGTMLLTLALILLYHLFYVELVLQDLTMPFGLEHMFPTITYYTLTVILLPLSLLLSRVVRIWRLTMRGTVPAHVPFSVYVVEAWTYVQQSVTQSLMRKCPDRSRWLGHWLLAFGTVIMLTVKVFALRWFQTENIYALYHPQRWLGYLAAAFILYGVGDIFIGRIRAKKEFYKETRFEDLIFPALLLLTALSGLGVHAFRYIGFELTSHYLYAFHIIVATPMLVVEMSFGKWSHMIYRPLAVYFTAVRERAVGRAPFPEVLGHAV
jgi:ferredoxin